MPLDHVSPLPRPAAGRGTTPTTSGPDGPPAQEAPQLRLANALAGAVEPERRAALAEELLSRLDGSQLSLRWMEGADRDAVYAMPALAWAALNEAVDGGIHAVDLPTPRDNRQLGQAIEGLNRLPGLRRLDLPVPETGVRIHLHELAARTGALTVQLDCWRPAGWRVTAPKGVAVTTRGVATRVAHRIKPSTQRSDAEGKALARARALDGIVYFHQPKDHKAFQDSPRNPRAWAGAQDELLAANLNGMASFADSKALASHGGPHSSPEARPKDPIVCRHLALQWLDDHASAQGLSYGHYATEQDITSHVCAQTEAQYARLRASPATALVQIDRLGDALQSQFQAMKPGERRRFLVCGESHAMALDLQLKPARGGEPAEYVVAFYDPNVTLSHQRVVHHALDAVKSLSLRMLAGDAAAQYFDPASTQVAALYAVGGPQAEAEGSGSATPPLLVGLSERDRHEPALLHQAMRCGHAPVVAAFVREALRDPSPGAAQARLAGATVGAGTLTATLADGHPDTPGTYVATLLESAAASLPSKARHALLMHAYQAPGSPVRLTPMDMALWGNPAATSAIVRSVLAADRGTLALPHAMDILGGTAATGRPPLETAVRHPAPLAGTTHQDIRMCLYNFVHEVVAADGLSVDDKLRLVAGPSAAADALRRDRPAVAAAMVCAILEAPTTQDLRRRALQAINLDLGTLLQGLAISTEPDAAHWLGRLVAALPDSGLEAATLATLLAPYAALASRPDPRQAPGVQALLQPDTLAAFDATVHTDTVFREAGLRPLRLDSNPSLMVCSAQREIPGLEGYRLRTGTRQGPDMRFEGIRYLLPLERLRPIYEQTRAQALARPWRDALDVAHPALLAGQMLHHTEACMAHVERALSCPDGARDDLALRRWLLSRPLNDGPMLHAMASSPTSHAPAGKRAQAIHDFVRAIVRSERLSLADKCDLLKVGHAFAGGFGTAAQAALASGRPDAAAAMACAILESGRPDRECAELLKALGVKLAETLRAPASGKSLEAGDWTARVLDGVQKIKLPQEDAVLPVLLRAGELGLGLKLSSKSAPRADQKHAA